MLRGKGVLLNTITVSDGISMGNAWNEIFLYQGRLSLTQLRPLFVHRALMDLWL